MLEVLYAVGVVAIFVFGFLLLRGDLRRAANARTALESIAERHANTTVYTVSPFLKVSGRTIPMIRVYMDESGLTEAERAEFRTMRFLIASVARKNPSDNQLEMIPQGTFTFVSEPDQ